VEEDYYYTDGTVKKFYGKRYEPIRKTEGKLLKLKD
jgi:hypothetical protein